VVGATLAVSALGIWIVSSRLDLDASLVDDWSALAQSPGQLHDMFRLAYHESGRFRPGFVVWNYLQWHTFGAPASLVGPNFWGIMRLVLLAAGLAAVTALLLRTRSAVLPPRWELALAAVPPLLVLTTPKFGVDLARFGPQEPALIGGMMLGGSLLVLGTRDLTRPTATARRARTVALLSIGYLLWLYGVYQKETSVCVLLLVPFFLRGHRGWLGRIRALPKPRRVALGAIAALVVLPLVHVGYETIAIAHRGELVYGMRVPSGSHAFVLFKDALEKMSGVLGSQVGWALVIAVAVGIVISAVLRRPNWSVVGLFVTAVAALAWSSQSGFAAAPQGSRYLMPTIALLAVAVALLIGSVPRAPRLIAVGAVVLIAALSVSDAHRDVEKWAATERQENAFVDAAARAQATGCPVVVTGLDLERQIALPILVKLQGRVRQTCAARSLFVASGTSDPDPALADTCAPKGRSLVGIWRLALERIALTRCAGVAPGAEAIVQQNQVN